MLLTIGLFFLFFLPVIESFSRVLGFALLLIGALLLGIHTVWTKKNLIADGFAYLWLMMLVIFGISTVFSWSFARSFTEFTRYFAYFLIFASLRVYPDKRKLVYHFLIPMILINSLVLTTFFIGYSLPFLKLPFVFSTMNLFFPTFGHNRIGDLLIFTLPLLISVANCQTGRYRKLLFFLSAVFCLGMLLLSQSRGALLSLSLVYLLFLIFGDRHDNKKQFDDIKYKWGIAISLTAIVFLLSSFIISNFYPKSNFFSIKSFQKAAGNEQRLEYFRQAFQGFLSSPIWGTGLDTFRYVSNYYRRPESNWTWTWYAHNHFLEIFQSAGFAGGIIFLFLIGGLILNCFRRYPQNEKERIPFSSALLIGAVSSALHSFLDFDWHYLSILMLVFIILSLTSDPPKTKKNPFISWLAVTFFALVLLASFSGIFDIDKAKNKAISLEKQDKIGEAVFELEKNKYLDPYNQNILRLLSDYYRKTGDNKKTHQYYEEIVLKSPSGTADIYKENFLLYIAEARDKLENNQMDGTIELINYSAKEFPYHSKINGNTFFQKYHALILQKQTSAAKKTLLDYLSLAEKEAIKSYFSSQNASKSR